MVEKHPGGSSCKTFGYEEPENSTEAAALDFFRKIDAPEKFVIRAAIKAK